MNIKKYSIIAASAIAIATFSPSMLPSAEARPRSDIDVSIGTVLRLPKTAVRINVGKNRYYHHGGKYYSKGKQGYSVVRAPRGARIRSLPRGYSRLVLSGAVYYRYDDVYYRKISNGYVVVETPAVAEKETIEDAEEAYETVWVGERKLLFKDGQFFRESPEGLVWVETPIGVTINSLPSGFTTIWHNEIEYFESDGAIYRKTPNGYKIVEKPWDGNDLPESNPEEEFVE
ncbi:DUF6515 family protein [Puniceicoccaceae bacterium K14]|nr:DUF6515 family protein [Puniceicoccaceae bacterium K14]